MRHALPRDIPTIVPNCGASRCHPIGAPPNIPKTIAAPFRPALCGNHPPRALGSAARIRNFPRGLTRLSRVQVIIRAISHDPPLADVAVIVIGSNSSPRKIRSNSASSSSLKKFSRYKKSVRQFRRISKFRRHDFVRNKIHDFVRTKD